MKMLEVRRRWAPIHWLAALGLTLRLYHYGRNPAMWHDEAANVLSVIRESFGELLGPLYLSSTGPPIFLWLQKCVTLALGDSTYALRLLPMLASCAGLVVFARIVQQTLAPIGAFCAVLLVACSDRLLWHAAEARHYSSDFLVATLLLSLFCLTTTWPTQRRAHLFALLSPVAVFASYPGAFLCGGVFLALWPRLHRERCWGAASILGASITLAFVAFYFITIRAQRSTAMDAAWAHTFPDWQRPWLVPFWAVRSTIGVIDYSCRPLGGILVAAAIMGSIGFWRARRRELVLFALGPLALAMSAALAKSYPYTGARTMVFAMPALILVIGCGIDEIFAWHPQRAALRPLALTLIAVPLAATFGLSCYRTIFPWPRAETAAASAYVLAHRQADEPVTANHWEYEYYFRKLGEKFSPELGLLFASPQPPRIWIVITAGDLSGREKFIAAAQERWRILERHDFSKTSVLSAAARLE